MNPKHHPNTERKGHTMHNQEERRREQAARIITEAWPHDSDDILTAIWDEDAFGALAYKLDKARQAGADPVTILRGIDEDTLDWAIQDADNLAAFLASRVPTQA